MTKPAPYRFSVAPMMEWTDRHCRVFHRTLTREALLYTEMVAAAAVIHGDRERLIGFSGCEHPVALQLGGSEPAELAEAAKIGADWGYDEINLNVGCPSDRVQSGRFGACLMREPDLVAECIAAMKQAVSIPVTVKSRIGVDDQDPEEVLPGFAEKMQAAGADVLIVHARKAWLKGLSPAENRTVPPLDYDLVYRLKQAMPDLPIVINGGIETLDEVEQHLAHVDGVMLGRAAYHDPWLLADVDRRILGGANPAATRHEALDAFMPYLEEQVAKGTRLNAMAKHLLGLFHGQPGARAYRRHLSEHMHAEGARANIVRDASKLIAGERKRAAEPLATV